MTAFIGRLRRSRWSWAGSCPGSVGVVPAAGGARCGGAGDGLDRRHQVGGGADLGLHLREAAGAGVSVTLSSRSRRPVTSIAVVDGHEALEPREEARQVEVAAVEAEVERHRGQRAAGNRDRTGAGRARRPWPRAAGAAPRGAPADRCRARSCEVDAAARRPRPRAGRPASGRRRRPARPCRGGRRRVVALVGSCAPPRRWRASPGPARPRPASSAIFAVELGDLLALGREDEEPVGRRRRGRGRRRRSGSCSCGSLGTPPCGVEAGVAARRGRPAAS